MPDTSAAERSTPVSPVATPQANPYRRIEVEAFCLYAMRAATVLVLMGAADDVHPSFLVPGKAVWSLNGEPMLPAEATIGDSGDERVSNAEVGP